MSANDPTIARIIKSIPQRWPSAPVEDPIWGLLRVVIAQQVSTAAACRTAERIKSAYPHLEAGSAVAIPDVTTFRAHGLPERRAQCCVTILQTSEIIRAKVLRGEPWQEALAGIKGLGPWTIAVFRIMVLREPDVLPLGDVGLERAIANVYGRRRNVARLGETWRPFRSVACWYLWRTLGNEQLG